MKHIKSIISALFLTAFIGYLPLSAQFDDVYYNPSKDDLPESNRTVSYVDDNYDNRYNQGGSGGYDGNNSVSDDSYDDESYAYNDGYGYDDYDSYSYTNRINRFHRFNSGFNSFYDPFYDPFWGSMSFNNGWGFGPYSNFGYSPFWSSRFYRPNYWWNTYPYGNSWAFDNYYMGGIGCYGLNSYYGWNNPYSWNSPYGWNNPYYNNYYGNDRNSTNRVYGARRGGAVSSGSGGYTSETGLREKNTRTNRTTPGDVEVRSNQNNTRSTRSTRVESPSNTERSGVTRSERSTPQRERTTQPRSNETQNSGRSYDSGSSRSFDSGSSRSSGSSGSSGNSGSSSSRSSNGRGR